MSLNNINTIRTGPRGGTPVVLVHAVGMDLNLWRPQIEALHKDYDVIAFDIPGHGLSDRLQGELSFAKFSAVLVQIIESLEAGPVNLVGISFGGMIIQTLALERPELVNSLTLIGTACTFSDAVRVILKERAQFIRKEGMKGIAPLSLARWLTPEFSARRPDIVDWITKTLYQQDALVHADLWDIISTMDTVSHLKKLSIPALVIVGEKDTSTPPSAANLLAQALKTTNLHSIPNTSHFTTLEAVEIFNDLLMNFFNSL
ncbi:MAG: alpha/beta fold hydrolase [Sphingobacteriaceae bacterium]|nr:MAG: alpha/beta fold hydrolase [Sphingobacteriaceae bacterium]